MFDFIAIKLVWSTQLNFAATRFFLLPLFHYPERLSKVITNTLN